jgi:hypothetical protein
MGISFHPNHPTIVYLIATERVTKCSQTRQKTRARASLIVCPAVTTFTSDDRITSHASTSSTRRRWRQHPHRRLLAYLHRPSKQTHVVSACGLPHTTTISLSHLIPCTHFPQLQPPEVAFQANVGRLSQGRASLTNYKRT